MTRNRFRRLLILKLYLVAILQVFTGFANDSTQIKINGYIGEKIHQVIEKRVLGQDVDMLVGPFKYKNETWCWQSEFWGKWMLSAVAAYKYKPSIALLEKMDYAVEGLLATQLKNGYIGNYGPERQLTAWDIWGRKYSMLGLIRYYEITGKKNALKGAVKVAEHLMSQIGPGKEDITYTGFYHGMASSSVLEPIIYLYQHTKKEEFFDFATYVVKQWETQGGPKLVSKALSNVSVKDRFPPPEKWWSWENGQKAYEMMSCYEGLLEYYKITKNQKYLEAIVKTVDNIIETEINIAGSGSAVECWYGGKEKQTKAAYHTMETCVTMTWLKLCNALLDITQDVKYADQIEKTLYNALLASVKEDASDITKYSPLMGIKSMGEDQCKLPIHCCNANGPRGFTLVPDFAVKRIGQAVSINYLGAFDASLTLENGEILQLNQKTQYPEKGSITLKIEPSSDVNVAFNLRIPQWNSKSSIKVNGESIDNIISGEYLKIERIWKKGDIIQIELEMEAKLHELNGYQAVTWGPLTLARDARFHDGDVSESITVEHEDKKIEITPLSSIPKHIWLGFSIPCLVGTNLESGGKVPKDIKFCDFASAGNTWTEESRYRVWIEKTLNVMNMKYESY